MRRTFPSTRCRCGLDSSLFFEIKHALVYLGFEIFVHSNIATLENLTPFNQNTVSLCVGQIKTQ
jgi:hypothetical protein